MYEPSLGTMSAWLRDVSEGEKRALVLDGAIHAAEGEVTRLVQGDPLPELKVWTPRDCGYTPKEELGDVGGMVVLGVWGIIFLYFTFRRTAYDFFDWLLGTFLILCGCIIGFFATLIVPLAIYNFVRESRAQKECDFKNRLEREEHDKRVRAIEAANEQKRSLKLPELRRTVDRLKTMRRSVGDSLRLLYAKNYLETTYHGLVPTTTMLGYITTGRCTCVYGHGGIVDTFVHDAQFNLLMGKLDDIIERLDEIQFTQAQLAAAIKSVNDNISGLGRSVRSFARSSHNDIDSQNIELCSNKMSELDQLIAESFAANVIPRQYRNIYAVYYLADYFSTSSADDVDVVLQTFVLEQIREQLDRIITLQEEIVLNQQIALAKQETEHKSQDQFRNETLRKLDRIDAGNDEHNRYLSMIESDVRATFWLSAADYLSRR